jgi:hypothetical protein
MMASNNSSKPIRRAQFVIFAANHSRQRLGDRRLCPFSEIEDGRLATLLSVNGAVRPQPDRQVRLPLCQCDDRPRSQAGHLVDRAAQASMPPTPFRQRQQGSCEARRRHVAPHAIDQSTTPSILHSRGSFAVRVSAVRPLSTLHRGGSAHYIDRSGSRPDFRRSPYKPL